MTMRSESERVTAMLTLIVAAGMPPYFPLMNRHGPILIYADRLDNADGRWDERTRRVHVVGYTWEIWEQPLDVASVTASFAFQILESDDRRLAIRFWRTGFAAPHRTLLGKRDTLTPVARKMVIEMAQRIETAQIAHALR